MSRFLTAVALVFAVGTAVNAADHVGGHYRSNGAYVAPYSRSSKDTSYNNNWSVRPNVNPYTGQAGSLRPTWNDRAPSSSRSSSYFGSPSRSGAGNGYGQGYGYSGR